MSILLLSNNNCHQYNVREKQWKGGVGGEKERQGEIEREEKEERREKGLERREERAESEGRSR